MLRNSPYDLSTTSYKKTEPFYRYPRAFDFGLLYHQMVSFRLSHEVVDPYVESVPALLRSFMLIFILNCLT